MFPVCPESKSISGRSLEVTRTYLRKGRAVYRSAWIKVSPRHPLPKVAVALPIGVLVLVMLAFILMVLGFTLLAVALMATISRSEEKSAN
jgi:hypothetical protein